MAEERPDVFIIGGANGAGKTTAALLLLPKYLQTFEFVNADEIARGLNPLKPETADMMAGRVMIERIKNLIESKKSFAFETTCAGRHHIHTLTACAEAGYCIHLIFLWLPSPEMAVHRVAQRIRQGGHAIQEDTIRRRYAAGLRNLIELYLPMADKALIINNTEKNATSEREFAIIAKKESGGRFTVMNKNEWDQINFSAEGGRFD